MENPHCNSVAYVNGIPILLTPTRPGKKQKRPGGANPLQRVKQQTSHWSRRMSISLKKSGMLKLGLSLVAMTVAASVQAKTLVYCSEGSPEGFNPAWSSSKPVRLK